MQRTSTLVVVVGIFFVVGVILLSHFSLQATGPSTRGGYTLLTEVDDSRGLESGAEVTRAGVTVGTVRSVDLADSNRNKVVVTMRLLKGAEIRKDAVASIQLKSLLGTHYVHITHGTSGSPLVQDGDTIVSEEVVDIAEALGKIGQMGGEAHDLIASVNENQKEFFEKINAVIDENRPNVKKTTDALADAAPKLGGFFDSVSSVTAALSEGKGTLGRLLYDESVYNSVEKTASNLEEISDTLRAGEGTLGKLIYDPELSDQLSDSFKNVSDASRSLKEWLDSNSGDLNELIGALKQAAPNIESAFANLNEVSKKINSSEGTLGKLVNDPELYDEARRAVSQIRKTFEEGEEQSVLRTFLGVFFGSMI
ncbi:MCE family protein [Candidatus Sumerlaeota bacterium]|nr:MCE family protein [Candidatus Sumerlaeota bacterium]